MAKMNVKSWGKAGALFGLLAWVVGWLVGKLFPEGIGTISFAIAPSNIDVGSQLRAGVDTSLGAKILSVTQGILPVGGILYQFLVVVISGIAVFLVGRFAYQYLMKGRTPVTRLLLTALYGSLGIGLLLGIMVRKFAIPIWTSVLATAIAFLIIATIYVTINKKAGTIGRKLAPIPE